MFCPECKSEYVEGITVCADCRVPLVTALPPEPDHTGEAFVRILSTYNAGDVAIIRSILEGTDISYYFQGRAFNDVGPLLEPTNLFVARSQVNTVKELLQDVEIHFLGVSPSEE
ncbi:MAG: hypothetical protein H6Q31_948 [Bacteroidetes bacterium]|jgi:hypothetical protein|nr:hypothetical protein [Bacteroidota bacterium]